MRKLIYFFASCLLLMGNSSLLAQETGRYDVRFVIQSIDCVNNSLSVDLEVKASASDSTFYMGDQNYKFTYNRQAIDLVSTPGSVTELGFSGALRVNPGNPNSLFQPYGPHTLIKIDPGTGSIALGILNIVWTPGRNGVLVEDTGWSPVSRLQFNIVDPNQTACLNLTWRDQSNSTHFTNITEVEAMPPAGSASTQPFSTTTDAAEQLYANVTTCLDVLCNPTFPVEWTHFDVSYNGLEAELNWSTALELNNDFFTVERSVNGNEFRYLGRVEAKGSDSDYTFIDASVRNIVSDRVYYRIRQVDVDGVSTTSDVVELVLDGTIQVLGVYPNPAQDFINLVLDAPNLESMNITINDASGRVVYKTVEYNVGQDHVKINTGNLSNGIYIVRVHDGISGATAKFQVVR